MGVRPFNPAAAALPTNVVKVAPTGTVVLVDYR